MTRHEGGCLCGAVRYAVEGEPKHVTICHCRFCQRATSSAFMVEPIFAQTAMTCSGAASTYDTVSAGSGKRVSIHACGACATKLWLSFERFADAVGIYGGTFDQPTWFMASGAPVRHIFTDHAQAGVVLPANTPVFAQHAILADGSPASPTIYDRPFVVQ